MPFGMSSERHTSEPVYNVFAILELSKFESQFRQVKNTGSKYPHRSYLPGPRRYSIRSSCVSFCHPVPFACLAGALEIMLGRLTLCGRLSTMEDTPRPPLFCQLPHCPDERCNDKEPRDILVLFACYLRRWAWKPVGHLSDCINALAANAEHPSPHQIAAC